MISIIEPKPATPVWKSVIAGQSHNIVRNLKQSWEAKVSPGCQLMQSKQQNKQAVLNVHAATGIFTTDKLPEGGPALAGCCHCGAGRS